MIDQSYPTRPFVSALPRSLDLQFLFSTSGSRHLFLPQTVLCPSSQSALSPLFVTQLPTCPALILRRPLNFPNLANGYACLSSLESCSSLDPRSNLRSKHAFPSYPPYSSRLRLVLVFVLSSTSLVFVLTMFPPLTGSSSRLCPALVPSSSYRPPVRFRPCLVFRIQCFLSNRTIRIRIDSNAFESNLNRGGFDSIQFE